ncbi:membrane or secreted protein [Allorhodopirellula heiligendammensis]|uniref:Membrane or secreted protein n=1 Tax=Allorhodopirellula heiligendammensis TaxID=2714739 RepID=A0A5C6C0Z2_9BACT|nr:membrane or secreted protein [Allorhodopirellula heiligendammensis]TWU16519.1 hypothetical protein Poly21_37240 [Allorhodopirellula heiligendammensis]
MRTTFSLGIVSCLLFSLVLTGCRSGSCLPPAGSLNQQRADAIVHDPFPLADIGPDDDSARPLSYQKSLPEPVRDRIVADSMPWLGR